jgi:hypothetical protein
MESLSFARSLPPVGVSVASHRQLLAALGPCSTAGSSKGHGLRIRLDGWYKAVLTA